VITIERIEFSNWLRYKGEHRVDLTPAIHAVVGRWEGNGRRSNWSGKTGLLEVIPFAFYGCHRKKLEDEWITEGERVGWVRVVLNVDGDDVAIERRRTKGGSTKLTVSDGTVLGQDGKPRRLAGQEAQDFIVSLLGLTEKDFFATCFVRQKKMSRFVTEEASKRMDLVVEWLQMQPLEQAHANTVQRLSAAVQAQTRLEVEHATSMTAWKDVALRHGSMGQSSEEVDSFLLHADADLEQAIADMEGEIALKERGREDVVKRQRDAEDAKEFVRVATVGKEIRRKVEAADVKGATDELRRCRQALDAAAGDVREAKLRCTKLQTVAAGEFDGKCPIGSVECPARQQINGMRRENARAYEEAKRAYDELTDSYEGIAMKRDAAEQRVQAIERDKTELAGLERQALRLRPAMARHANAPTSEVGEDDQDLVTDRDNLVRAKVQLEQVRRDMAFLREAAGKRDGLKVRLDESRDQVDLLREASHVLGRTGAQREMARRMIAEVEQGANDALRECGVDLQVQVRWSHDGSGLAKSCEECGATFPSSAKVKVCERCGAERGQNVVNRLDVVLSDQSGAAEDLAGVAIQLAAMRWLREERQSALSLAIMDEPFGSLDEQHRESLATHLATMLGRSYGVAQALITAHHGGIMDALPARIEVVAGPDGSKIGGVDDGGCKGSVELHDGGGGGVSTGAHEPGADGGDVRGSVRDEMPREAGGGAESGSVPRAATIRRPRGRKAAARKTEEAGGGAQ
jgi:hypothetical protein